jgi:hypothetical protein
MRSFSPFVRVVLFAACLLAAAPGSAAGLFGGPPEPGQMPSRFVRFDGMDHGLWLWTGWPQRAGGWPQWSIRLAKVTIILDRVRFGAALGDGYGPFDDWSGDMMLPLHVGYTLLSRPKRTWFFYGAVPDIYAEVSGSLWDSDPQSSSILSFRFDPALRVAFCCDVDYYGLGIRLEGGWADIRRHLGPTPRISFLYAGLQLRVLTFGIGF